VPEKQTKPVILRGIPASPGIGIGKAFVFKEEALSYVFRALGRDEVRKEIQRFRQAVMKTRTEIIQSRDKVLKVLGKSHAALIDVHLLILEDALFSKDIEKKITQELMNAEAALVAVLDNIGRTFSKLGDEYFRQRKDDIMDVGKHVMRHLLGHTGIMLSQLSDRSIIIAHDLSPSDTLSLKEEYTEGFATDIGGRTSHAAILAQGMEIPAVVGLKDITAQVNTGDHLIIDGNEGVVIINPSMATLENYRKEREVQLAKSRELEKIKDLPAQTKDGHKIILASNLETPEEIKAALGHGAEGIGLYRTEFLYLNRSQAPTEDEHFENYRTVARQMLPYSVIIRTLDIGGDKLGPMGIDGFGDEPNPFLGLRGIRLCLRYPELFKTQLRAILRASVEGKLKIMYPMITSLEELREANRILDEVKRDMNTKNIPFAKNIEVGVMVETPSAAMIADLLSAESDFLSLGTNDLIQYTVAVDRVNENVASLYNPLHLAVLRLIERVVTAGHDAGKWVGMCGEMAGDPAMTRILLGMGLDEFSVAASAIPKVKMILRETSYEECKKLADDVLRSKDQESLMKRLSSHSKGA
jgi:phosphotransferase system enzyme I (PtsI)